MWTTVLSFWLSLQSTGQGRSRVGADPQLQFVAVYLRLGSGQYFPPVLFSALHCTFSSFALLTVFIIATLQIC